MRRATYLAIVAVASWSYPALDGARARPAVQGDDGDLTAMMHMLSGAETKRRNAQGFHDEVVVDGPTVIRQIPNLQQMGLLSPDISATAAAVSGDAVPVAMCLQVSTVALMSAFKSDPKLDKASFSCGVTAPDDYGHRTNHPALSFRFNRTTYGRIDWQNFEFTKLPKVAPGFRYSRWALHQLGALG